MLQSGPRSRVKSIVRTIGLHSRSTLSQENGETKPSACVLLDMKMKAMVFFLGAIPAVALAGCEMDLEEMNDAELAEFVTFDEAYVGEFDDSDPLVAEEGETPEMGVAAFGLGVDCDEVFDFVDAGEPSWAFPIAKFSYQEAPKYSALEPDLAQGVLGHTPISNGIRAQGGNIQAMGSLGGGEVMRIDVVKVNPRFQLPYTSIRLKLASNTSYLVNKAFTPRVCQQFASHATVFADSSDGSQLTMTYGWLYPGG